MLSNELDLNPVMPAQRVAAQRQPTHPRGMPTAAQLRAARALMGWSMEELAARSGVSSRTISRAEETEQAVSVRTLRRLAAAYDAAGVEFTQNTNGMSVRLRRRP